MSAGAGWRIFVDTGGTFTDALAVGSTGEVRRAKILSSGALRGTIDHADGRARLRVRADWSVPDDFLRGFRFRLLRAGSPEGTVGRFEASSSTISLEDPWPSDLAPGQPFEAVSPEEAPVLAARLLTRTPPGRPLPVESLRLATTLGTNALLERRGVRTALFVTRGFGDLILIGTQQRPDLFALEVKKPAPLYESVVEVGERIAADGSVLRPLEEREIAEAAARLSASGVDSAAVALLHSHRNPRNEERVQEILEAAGFRHVSRSSALAPFIKILPRAETAVVDAYLAPVVRSYLDRVGAGVARGRLHVMTSAGGLVTMTAARPKDMLLSGPAGGVVGAALAGRRSGFQKVIAFDMGGTSTDVARFDGDYEYTFEHQVGDAHLVAPALAIESVAAGGGSICAFDAGRLRVGPRSAGASPGPACYGAGGPLTLTDVNLLLGRLDPARFGIPIDTRAAERAADALLDVLGERGALADEAARSPARPAAREEILSGLVDIADERMADAIKTVSVRRGYDPADYALVAFGGAGGQHACGVAARLGIPVIVVPADAGLLSALGLRHAVIERFAEAEILEPLQKAAARIDSVVAGLERQAIERVESEGIPRDAIEVRRRTVHLRFVGQDSVVEVPHVAGASLEETFARRYAALFGHRPEGRPIEVESIRVVASSGPDPGGAEGARPAPLEAKPQGTRRAHVGGRHADVPVFDRGRLEPGARLRGPALVFEAHAATLVEIGWSCDVDAALALVLRRDGAAASSTETVRPEAVRLELFTNRFRAIASDMGERLRRTAVSTNIKERLDFSCALLDTAGELVVNAPHIPVHLGALGLCVRRLRETLTLAPGDVAVTNHPGFGGSHLPDVTVVTPVFADGAPANLIGYVASRAHHAEIGGSRPGSMPPAARTLAEEGVVIPPLYLVRGGVGLWEEVRRLLLAPPWPTRAVEDNLADLRAAVAANHAGAEALRALAREHGAATVARYMEALKELAGSSIVEALREVPSGRYAAEESLDDGTLLRLALTLKDGRAAIDFTGSAAVHPGNLNATTAVVRSVVMYVLRLLLRRPLPLNEGLMRAVDLVIPRGLLNPDFDVEPARAPAIVGGNIETSQRLVDTLLKALGLAACSQGTMNNVLFGDRHFGYYETICGGCGAGPGFDGASAVHSHMTNTRMTDAEILEHRYPVRVERFAVRRGSGGAGRFRGGDGAVREIVFLSRVSLSVLGQHRTVAPYGLAGGAAGQTGAQRVVRQDGGIVELGSIDSCELGPGDRLIVETPGGGGYGPPRGNTPLQ